VLVVPNLLFAVETRRFVWVVPSYWVAPLLDVAH